MDIAEYIIELLQQQKVAVVPGLGSFHTSKVEGYYNKEQQQFYPPSLQAQFDPEQREGTDLADLISEKRQISPASSRYFIEKFVTTLKDRVQTDNVPLGNMGVFSLRRNELAFEPNSLNESYELFYGLAPAKLKRNSAFRAQAIEAELGTASPTTTSSPFFSTPRNTEPVTPVDPPKVLETPAPVEAPKAAEIPANIETPPTPINTHFIPVSDIENREPVDLVDGIMVDHAAQPTHQPAIAHDEVPAEEEYVEEEEKRGVNIWLILSIIIVILGVAVIGLYKYQPHLFDRIFPPQKQAAPKPIVKVSTTDSLNALNDNEHDTAVVNPDKPIPKQVTPSTLPTAAPVDTFGVVIAALPSASTAETEAQRYRKLGFPQTEVRRKPNSKKLFFVNVGTYFNLDSAQANRQKILKQLDLSSNEISVQKYPYKKP